MWDLIQRNVVLFKDELKKIPMSPDAESVFSEINKTIHFVTLDYENFRFNRAIARIRELTNIIFLKELELKKNPLFFKKILENIAILLSPMTPHISEEIWFLLGNKNFLIASSWPKVEKKYLEVDKVTIAIQINGKLKGTVELQINTVEKKVKEKVLIHPNIRKILGTNKPKRIIVVKNKIVNIVL